MAKLGTKEILYDNDMKVTLTNEEVSNVEQSVRASGPIRGPEKE
jgi:hypothetical protein